MGWFEKIPLKLGSVGKLLVREEEISLFSTNENPYRILYASDIHLSGGNSGKLIGQLAQAVSEARPQLILFGGDLVDNVEELPALTECVRELCSIAPVASVAGNHDRQAGLLKVQRAVEKGGGFWLGPESYFFKIGNRKVRVDGQLKPGSESVETRLLCAHYPDIFQRAVDEGYRGVFAGHLHGCQFVFWGKEGKLFPGAWFYQWNGLRFREGACSLFVSRGVSDSFPIRWNCPREVLLCKVY